MIRTLFFLLLLSFKNLYAMESEILPQTCSSFFEYENEVYFCGYHPDFGDEILKIDKNGNSISLFKNISPGKEDKISVSFFVLQEKLFFFYATPDKGTIQVQLWKTDGTKSGTSLIKANLPEVEPLLFNNRIWITENAAYFRAYASPFDIVGSIWRSDGTAEGTIDLNLHSAQDVFPGTFGTNILAFDTQALYYEERRNVGQKNVARIMKIRDNSLDQEVIHEFTDDCAAVVVTNYDGKEASKNIFNDNLFFNLNCISEKGSDGFAWDLYSSDGSVEGVVKLTDDDDLTTSIGFNNGKLIFLGLGTGNIVSTDGLTSETFGICDPGELCSSPRRFKIEASNNRLRNQLFFLIEKSISQTTELWVTDGNQSNTFTLAEGLFVNFRSVGEQKIFTKLINEQGVLNYELWVSDGTKANTQSIFSFGASEILPGLLIDDSYYFFIASNSNGRNHLELWKSDGSKSGTKRVKVLGGVGGRDTVRFVNKFAFFVDGKIWRSDGSVSGTFPIEFSKIFTLSAILNLLLEG